jgi:hypothetical protein
MMSANAGSSSAEIGCRIGFQLPETALIKESANSLTTAARVRKIWHLSVDSQVG